MAMKVDFGDQLLDNLQRYLIDKSSLSLSEILAPLLAAAEGGVVEAQYTLGKIFELLNLGESRFGPEAVKWYRQAAEAGFPAAQIKFFQILRDGIWGEAKNTLEALKWLRRAAEGGLALAQFQLAVSNKIGEFGLPIDLSEAAKWFLLAAERGHFPSQNEIGLAYLTGEGVPKDQDKAVKWLSMGMSLKKVYNFNQLTEADLASLVKVSEFKSLSAFYLEKKDPGSLDGDFREDYQSINKVLNKLIMKLAGKQKWEDEILEEIRKLSAIAQQSIVEINPLNRKYFAAAKAVKRQKKKAGKRR
ncbi:MAG: sel1 repeat family protein [Deltaproteobacteria bacterium]|jgi:hypothetical protein|nr:sel1 repeat family protein [Deltaproteobacteria bacterium]